MSKYILEVCVDSIESARNAVEAGADRLEICGNLANGGGTTPSLGLVKRIIAMFPEVPLMVMIRPRCGDFVYTDLELDVMREDIDQFKRIGAAGVVLGVLTVDGTVDIERTKRLTEAAEGLQVTFHRAFDMTRGLKEALMHVATIPGISRILTSGGNHTVLLSLIQLADLLRAAPSHLTIMPGSGISAVTIREISGYLVGHGLREVHMSGGQWKPGRSVWRKAGMGMGVSKEKEWDIWTTSYENVRAVREALDAM